MNYSIITNVLPLETFGSVKKFMESNEIPWYFYPAVGHSDDSSDSYFTHTFFDNGSINSNSFSILNPVLDVLKCTNLLRVRANLYTAKPTLIEHARHTDFDYEHKAFIFYVNTNDGFTRLEESVVINSIENQGVFFDGSKNHNSTNCTNAPCRITLSVNYI